MFNKQDCQFDTYRGILKKIKQTGRYMDYIDAINSNEFIVLRHDIEFSIDRAYKLAEVEAETDFKSSYFVQITNNSYNALSKKNIDLIKEMLAMGHHIGLHYHRNGLTNIEYIKKEIVSQTEMLSQFLGISIDRFSLHRPAVEHLKANINIDGMMNTYGSNFFTFLDDVSNMSDLTVKYIADSNHQWKYGLPNEEYFEKYPKIHLLVHPLSWSKDGAEHVDCFREIVNEKREEFINTIKNEWKIYSMLKNKL